MWSVKDYGRREITLASYFSPSTVACGLACVVELVDTRDLKSLEG